MEPRGTGKRWLSVVARVAGRPLERRDRVDQADAIVVLGAPLRPDGSLSDVVEERVRAGVALWQRGVAPLLCCTGGRGPGIVAARAEAEVMGERAEALGVSKGAILLEVESSNTSRNASNIERLLRERGLSSVVVVSQPFHLRRSVLWFQRVGLVARGWHIGDSLQYEHPQRALRWITKEYGSLARDLLVTRRPGG
jgi:uncharacterized SAM-binding protein YcdF (DUF218 family)